MKCFKTDHIIITIIIIPMIIIIAAMVWKPSAATAVGRAVNEVIQLTG